MYNSIFTIMLTNFIISYRSEWSIWSFDFDSIGYIWRPLYLYIFINNYPKRCTHVQVVTWQAWELMMHDALVFLQVLGTVVRVQRNRIFLICHRHAGLGNCSIVNCWPFISADSHHKMWLRSRCEETPSVDISGDISWQQCMVTCSEVLGI